MKINSTLTAAADNLIVIDLEALRASHTQIKREIEEYRKDPLLVVELLRSVHSSVSQIAELLRKIGPSQAQGIESIGPQFVKRKAVQLQTPLRQVLRGMHGRKGRLGPNIMNVITTIRILVARLTEYEAESGTINASWFAQELSAANDELWSLTNRLEKSTKSLSGYVSASMLELKHGIPHNRLSEAVARGAVRTKKAPRSSLDPESAKWAREQLVHYHKLDALRHCSPKRKKTQSR